MTIGNDTHRLSVNKDKKNIPQLATDICNDNSAALGFKEGDDVMSLCIQPVSNSLDKQVDLKLQQLVSVSVLSILLKTISDDSHRSRLTWM